MKAKRLIEVTLPSKEISAESARDKTLRQGHISTLHVWWARRPLSTCRALVFASLVTDPMDNNCPQAFREAITTLLRDDSLYKPYPDIPYTSVPDPMDDNSRNRLTMFIGKFSDNSSAKMLKGESPDAKNLLSEGSLIKFENRLDGKTLRIARELIFTAYNAELREGVTYGELHREFDTLNNDIEEAQDAIYAITDRHKCTTEVAAAEERLKEAIKRFQDAMPSVLDPFAGGGAIPLEAARLGCRSYGNDINPVAHIVERVSAEFPQRFGKPIRYSAGEFRLRYGDEGLRMLAEKEIAAGDWIDLPNRLSFDVEYYVRHLLGMTEAEAGHLYPHDADGHKLVAYYWVRTALCSNPGCRAEVPLLKQFYLAKKRGIYLNPTVSGTKISFEVKEGSYDEKAMPSWLMPRSLNLVCPCCGSVTSSNDLKKQFTAHITGQRMLAAIYEGEKCKTYRLPTSQEIDSAMQMPQDLDRLTSKVQVKNNRDFNSPRWGIDDFGEMFSSRQMYVLNTILKHFAKLKESLLEEGEYGRAVVTYLAIWIDRMAAVYTMFGRWNRNGENVERIMDRQAISMMFDYPEINPFSGSTGSGRNQLRWITDYLDAESGNEFCAEFCNAGSGEKSQFTAKSITATVTDPPYYDAIAYADCSDFFYMWLRRTLGDVYPQNFATPQTPKTEECTALKHHHDDSAELARRHFEDKLTEIFRTIEMQTRDVVSIMFAHQSSEAWSTLCNSILSAGMNITGSWPMDTEMKERLVNKDNSALESSVTVACRPSQRRGFAEYRDVKAGIERKVAEEVEALYKAGFRGADLLTACFGPAVSVFGQYESVEKSNGDEVTIDELLNMAKEATTESFLKGVPGDELTKFYVGWLHLNGAGDTKYDDATKFSRIIVNVEIKDIIEERLLIKTGGKYHPATATEHIGESIVEGTRASDPLISQAHRLMLTYRCGDRPRLLRLVHDLAPDEMSPLWRLLSTLKELLPRCDDYSQVQGLLSAADNLRRDSAYTDNMPQQQELDL